MEDRFKFRAWDKHAKKMLTEICHKPDYGLLLSGEFIRLFEGYDGATEVDYDMSEGAYILMQSTGIKDIKRKLVFDQDFVEDENGNIYLVEQRNGSWVALHAPKTRAEQEGDVKWDYLYEVEAIEIIGDIYENPELLEVES